jgi:thiamine pyrophosphate-dependent acetolactate synthase large subunit-like protein
MKGDAIVADILKREGTKQLIGFPHSELFDSGAVLDIPPVIARTERVAVNIAEGYARMNEADDPAVVTVQYGPGAENAFGGVAQAYNDGAPILFLPTGYPRGMETVAPNFASQRNFSHITKWCEAASQVEQLPRLMRTALSRLRNGGPGPVLLELPIDVLADDHAGPIEPHASPRRAAPQADPGEIAEIVDTLMKAKAPLIFAGQGVLRSRATDELLALAELTAIPVATTPNGKSAFPENHALALGTAGKARPATVDHFFEKADVILAIGTSLTRSLYITPIPAGKTILQVTIEEADLGKDYPLALGVVGDARAVLRQIIDRFETHVEGAGQRDRHAVLKEVKAVRGAFMQQWLPLLTTESGPVSPYRVGWELMRAVDRTRTVVTHDAGHPRDQFMTFYEATVPGGYLGWGKTTQLGTGLGLMIGAKLARPDWLAVNVMGEAAFGMVGLDFETAVRCNLPILTVVMRNELMGGYGGYMPTATAKYGANRLSGEYAPIARALGGHGETVTHARDLAEALRRCIAKVESGTAALLEVVTHEEGRLAMGGR